MHARNSPLWRDRDFARLWLGQSISLIGSQITLLALPLTAVLLLKATPTQMGILTASQYAPALVIGLFAGVWVDRSRRRPLLIASDLGRALLLATIPVITLAGLLRIEYLYVIAFAVGILTVVFDLAYMSFLPTLVPRDRLVEANSKLQISQSIAQIGGPGLAGVLIQMLSAPAAILFDAVSFLVSALSLGMIRSAETALADPESRRGVWQEIREGVRVVVGNRLLWALAGSAGTLNLFVSMLLAVNVLYFIRDLALTPFELGIVFAAFGPGTLVGALLIDRLTQRFGVGSSVVGAILLAGLAILLIPLARGPVIEVISTLVLAQFLSGFTGPIYSVTTLSLRQSITPDHLLGRVGATMRFLTWSMLPAGSIIGGFLGQSIGLRSTLTIAAVGVSLAAAWILLSPIRTLGGVGSANPST